MTWERCLFPLFFGLLVCASCSDDDSTPDDRNTSGGDNASAGDLSGNAGTSAGKAGSSGSAGSQSGGANTEGGNSGNVGGAPAEAGMAGASGASCHGDAKRWAGITADPAKCQTANDCCVVINGCLSEGQIVGVADFEAAQAAWPFCDEDCNDCIPPSVIVACDNGKCVGAVDPDSPDDGTSHCGDTTPMGPEPSQTFTCQ